MNDRYLFRGKREDNNEWVTGDLMQWSDGTIRICVESGVDEKITVTVIPETVGQCGAYHFSAFTSLWKVQYEVIGNIHDNKFEDF